MKHALFVLTLVITFAVEAQEIDNVSKKELKEMVLRLQKERDSLLLVNKQLLEKHTEKEQLIKDLNEILVQTESQLAALEFEKSSCRLEQDSLKQHLLIKELEVHKLHDSLQKTGVVKTPKLECSYKEEKIPDCDFPVRIKTCMFGMYKNVKSANPDFKGN